MAWGAQRYHIKFAKTGKTWKLIKANSSAQPGRAKIQNTKYKMHPSKGDD
jgi:hypothetical protein